MVVAEDIAAAPRPARPVVDAPMLRPRRSPRLVAAGVLCAMLGGLGAAFAWQQTTTSTPVVVMQRPVARGEVVTSADLGVVTIGSAPGVKTIPADQVQGLVGKQALVDLPAGSLVGEGAIGTEAPEKGVAELGLRLGAGRLPTRDLPAGTRVLLVAVVTKGDDVSETPKRTFEAVVARSAIELPDGATWVLDVKVAETDAPAVAQLAATDQLVVVKKSGA